jgi:hypothetical protein
MVHLKKMITDCIGHLRSPYLGGSLGIIGKEPVDVAVNKIARLASFDEGNKTVKALVARIFSILNMPWRGVANNEVHPSVQPYGGHHKPNHIPHL